MSRKKTKSKPLFLSLSLLAGCLWAAGCSSTASARYAPVSRLELGVETGKLVLEWNGNK
jgi:predicted component of type VI protein secretion system